MKTKYKRLKFTLSILSLFCIGLFLILKNFNENIVFFYSPSDLKHKNIENIVVRVGGMIVKDSIKHSDGLKIEFTITDQNENLIIIYEGMLPNLFREGQGIVAKGKYQNKLFVASELLAKHDENYMPKEVINSLKEGKCPTCR